MDEATKEEILAMILKAILATVEEAGDRGAPGGHIYAALMVLGITFEQFQIMMTELVSGGLLVRRGPCYFKAEKK